MIRKKKKYRKPRRVFDKTRIEEENQLIEKYGLKNKKEIWKAEASIERIRSQAKKLITASQEEQEKLLDKLNKIGLKVKSIAEVLALNTEDWLRRRLQSILVSKNLARPKEARQAIVHKHVSIGGKIVNIPSYIVKTDEEDRIKIRRRLGKKGEAEVKEEKTEEKEEGKEEEKNGGK